MQNARAEVGSAKVGAYVSGGGPSLVVIRPSRANPTLIRVLDTASRRDSVHIKSISELGDAVTTATKLIACDAEVLSDVCDMLGRRPTTRVMVWSRTADVELLRIAAEWRPLVSIIGWCDEADVPDVWQLQLAIDRLIRDKWQPVNPDAVLAGSLKRTWHPRSTEDMRALLDDIRGTAERLRVPSHVERRILLVAHELLMNAIYDAPSDEHGQHLYAADRTQSVYLQQKDAPRVGLAIDGVKLMLQVADRFGGLRRKHVYDSILRGDRGRQSGAKLSDVVNTEAGGAGIGLHRICTGAGAAIFEVVPGESTVVTTVFGLDMPQRNYRLAPRSLHFFRAKRRTERR